MSTPVIIIVPGAWHKPRHYRHVLDGLHELNYDAVAITLPSVDSNPSHTTWDQDAKAIRLVIVEHLDSGRDVVTVAHSYGGIPMSEAVKGLGKKVREEQGLAGGVVRLVYMCAMALAEGQTLTEQVQPQTPEEIELDRQRQKVEEEMGAMRFTEGGNMLLGEKAVRGILYNRCDPKDIDEAVSLLGSHPPGPLAVPVTYTAYLEIPSTYIVCENDRALSVSYQERMIAQGKGAFAVERCQEGHSPFLSNPAFIVECIRRAAGENI